MIAPAKLVNKAAGNKEAEEEPHPLEKALAERAAETRRVKNPANLP